MPLNFTLGGENNDKRYFSTDPTDQKKPCAIDDSLLCNPDCRNSGTLFSGSPWVLGVFYALILICPLGHIFMMRGMHSKSKDKTSMQPRIEQIDDE